MQAYPIQPQARLSKAFRLREHKAAQWSADGRIMASVVPGAGVQIWDADKGRKARDVSIEGRWSLSPEGRRIAYVGPSMAHPKANDSLQWVELSTGKERTVPAIESPNGMLAWSRDESVLAVGTLSQKQGVVGVTFMDTETWQPKGKIGLPDAAFSIQLTHDGQHLLSRHWDGSVYFIKTSDGTIEGKMRFAEDGASAAVFSANEEVEFLGNGCRDLMACRFGPLLFPSSLCSWQFERPGLSSIIHKAIEPR